MSDDYKEKFCNLKFKQMDVHQMTFEDKSFDSVIDKGLFDAVACSQGDVKMEIESMLTEIYRVLRPNGVYVCISHGSMNQRKKHLKNLQKFNWKITQELVQKPGMGTGKTIAIPREDPDQIEAKKNFNFIYTCKKTRDELVDSSDEDAVEAFNLKKEADEKRRII